MVRPDHVFFFDVIAFHLSYLEIIGKKRMIIGVSMINERLTLSVFSLIGQITPTLNLSLVNEGPDSNWLHNNSRG